MKGYFAAALCCLALATPGFAKKNVQNSTTTVTGREPVIQWVTRISKDLDQHLHFPDLPQWIDLTPGTVKIAFHCSEDGTPTDLRIARSSGMRSIDRAALNGVSRIRSLHPLPLGLSHRANFEAWIVYANDEDAARKVREKLNQEVKMAILDPRGNPTVILGVSG